MASRAACTSRRARSEWICTIILDGRNADDVQDFYAGLWRRLAARDARAAGNAAGDDDGGAAASGDATRAEVFASRAAALGGDATRAAVFASRAAALGGDATD